MRQLSSLSSSSGMLYRMQFRGKQTRHGDGPLWLPADLCCLARCAGLRVLLNKRRGGLNIIHGHGGRLRHKPGMAIQEHVHSTGAGTTPSAVTHPEALRPK
jgi:hypothetical protein